MDQPLHKKGSVLGGALLVTGTTVGGGMLALPVLTSLGGFIPSLFLYIACWLFMTITGLLLLEISLQMPDGVNIVSMAEKTLGWPGKIAAWGLYLFLFYCLTVAYIVGCGDIISTFFDSIPRYFGPFLFVLIFAPFLYAGTRLVSKLNFFLMGGLATAYIALVIIGIPEIAPQNLKSSNWPLSLMALPVAFVAFAYQGIIPTLTSYLHHDAPKIKKSLWIGTSIALLIYVIWQTVILGIIPLYGEGSLSEALQEGRNAVYPLKDHLNNSYIYTLGQYFAFFALVTSFFGVTLGLNDFLADGLKIKKNGQGKLILLGLILIPPLSIAAIYPDIFLRALDLAGGYGSALLLGLLPIIMVAKWRKDHPLMPRLVKGGNGFLIALALFVFLELILEIKKL